MSPDVDRLILQRMAHGDGAALAELYDEHGRAVYSLAMRILSDQGEAEDLTQDVFTLAWRNAARYDPSRGVVAAWLLVTTRTRAIDRLRSRRVRPSAATADDVRRLDAIPDAAPSVEMIVADRQMAGRVRDALATLPEDQRQALELAYFEGLSHSEIGERTGNPLGTIKTRIRTGLLKLRQAMGTGKEGLTA
ncbi:MAG: sigma-70 family RNA polymerase sigma factor [Vicinamibacterales bacterium]